MGFEDLFQILIALAVLFGLFGGRKKQPKTGDPQRRPPQPRPAPPRPTGQTRQEPARQIGRQTPLPPRPVPQPPARQLPVEVEVRGAPEGFADEVYRILSGELERRREDTLESEGAETAEARNRFEVEANSLETLEPAGEVSHAAFHKKYLPAATPVPAAPGPGATRGQLVVPGFALRGRASLRQAIVWSEILGPPKGLG